MKKYKQYNGEKKYIFASFSEIDEEAVETLLDNLIPIGYRFKLEDKGAAASSTVNDLVASHLMLLVLTDNYIADPQCYRLLQKAEALHKPMIIYLPEDTQTVKEVVMRLIKTPEITLTFRPGEKITDSKSANMLLDPTLGFPPELANKVFAHYLAEYERSGDPKALDKIKLSASENCVKAILWLGKRELAQARIGKRSYATAVELLYRAAKQGDTEAIYILGKMLLDGEAFESSPRLAYTYILKAARHGYPMAQFELANMYDKSIGTEIDKRMAIKWYASAADKGVVEAFMPLGIHYLEGVSIERNTELAIKYLTRSAASGVSEADLLLAHLYKDGTDGIKPDAERSAKHFKAAAEAGLCEAQYFYSLCLKKGHGCKKDRKEALYWMKRAANDRSDGADGSPDAMYRLGVYYHKGIGCKKNLKNAFICYYNAARLGHTSALRAVSECYKRGIGISQNAAAARAFREKYRKALEFSSV